VGVSEGTARFHPVRESMGGVGRDAKGGNFRETEVGSDDGDKFQVPGVVCVAPLSQVVQAQGDVKC
jgi:hypothetical protein